MVDVEINTPKPSDVSIVLPLDISKKTGKLENMRNVRSLQNVLTVNKTKTALIETIKCNVKSQLSELPKPSDTQKQEDNSNNATKYQQHIPKK